MKDVKGACGRLILAFSDGGRQGLRTLVGDAEVLELLEWEAFQRPLRPCLRLSDHVGNLP